MEKRESAKEDIAFPTICEISFYLQKGKPVKENIPFITLAPYGNGKSLSG